MDNEQIIRRAYKYAEDHDVPGWAGCFAEGGTFTDESTGIVYGGPDEYGILVDVYKRAFSDMHRDLHRFYVTGDIVVVQLALQGTHDGPLELPQGTIPPTGRRMDAPCCDVFELSDGKIKRFDCYPSGTIIAAQLGLAGSPDAAVVH